MAQRATSLGPKPSLFIHFCFCFSFFFVPFLSLLLIEKPCFPPKKAFLVYFLCFSFFLPQPFLTSPFFCFSFSVSLLLLSFFFPSCLSFWLSFCFLFLSLFIFLSSLLLFSEKNNMKMLNCNLCFHQSILFFYGFLSCFSFQIPFPYLCFFLILSYVFC